MAKSFKDKNPTDFNSGTTTATEISNSTTSKKPKEHKTSSTTSKNAPIEDKVTEKRKPGRPPVSPDGKLKAEYTRKVNIAIPKDVMDKVNIASRCHGGTITDYINTLINKDLGANMDKYQLMIDTINNL